MELLLPKLGLFFWSAVIFLSVFLILKKFAWKPILQALSDRESSIEDALKSAEEAKKQMEQLKADNEKLLMVARSEREAMLKEAREMKDQIISDAKKKAEDEGRKLVESAKDSIQKEKMAALADVKNQVAVLSLEIAEKILNKKFEDSKTQESVINDFLETVHLN